MNQPANTPQQVPFRAATNLSNLQRFHQNVKATYQHISQSINPKSRTYRAQYLEKFVKGNFIDPEFPPNDYAILGKSRYLLSDKQEADKLKKAQDICNQIEWKRIGDIYETPKLFAEDPQQGIPDVSGTDIKKGSFENHYMCAGISCIAEIPGLVKRVICQTEVSKKGVYSVYLCLNGEWVEVSIDDYFPVYRGTNTPFGISGTTKGEFWMMVLEKAYAKAHGGYFNIMDIRNEYDAYDVVDNILGSCAAIKDNKAFLQQNNPQLMYLFWRTIDENVRENLITTTLNPNANNPNSSHRLFSIIGTYTTTPEIQTHEQITVQNIENFFVQLRNTNPDKITLNSDNVHELRPSEFDKIHDNSILIPMKEYLAMFSKTVLHYIQRKEMFNHVTTKCNLDPQDYDVQPTYNGIVPTRHFYLVRINKPGVYLFNVHQFEDNLVKIRPGNTKGEYDLSFVRMTGVFIQNDLSRNLDLSNLTKTDFAKRSQTLKVTGGIMEDLGLRVKIDQTGYAYICAEVHWQVNDVFKHEFNFSVIGPEIVNIAQISKANLQESGSQNLVKIAQNKEEFNAFMSGVEYQMWKSFFVEINQQHGDKQMRRILQTSPVFASQTFGQKAPGSRAAQISAISPRQEDLDDCLVSMISFENASQNDVLVHFKDQWNGPTLAENTQVQQGQREYATILEKNSTQQQGENYNLDCEVFVRKGGVNTVYKLQPGQLL